MVKKLVRSSACIAALLLCAVSGNRMDASLFRTFSGDHNTTVPCGPEQRIPCLS